MIEKESVYTSSPVSHFKSTKVISKMMAGLETGTGISLDQIEFNPDGIIKRLGVHAS
jgi:hypothetical protein